MVLRHRVPPRAEGPPDFTVLETPLVDGTTRALDLDLGKSSLRTRFDPEPRILPLDGNPLHVEAIVTHDDDSVSPPWVANVPLVLTNESDAIIARSTSGPGGRASFDVERSKLGRPGFGELRVRFDGNADTMPSEHRAPVRRDARVTLALAESLGPGVPEDGITFGVLASTVAGPPPGGSLEARAHDVDVGAAPLSGSRTNLTVAFSSEETSGVYVRVHYVPDAPYYVSGDDLTVAVPVQGPSPWRRVPILVSALCVGAWLVLSRRARRKKDAQKTMVMARPPVHDGTEGIAVRNDEPTGAWTGVVVDAHDGTPVARARVAIELPSFDTSVLTSTFTDDEGRFRLELEGAPPPGSRIVAEGPLHAPLKRPVPKRSALEIALVARKRRILERLVAWARRRGPPFDQRPEPTPAQIRRAAGDAAEGRWAEAIERAAFDRGEVDARAEAAIDELAPPGEDPPPAR